MQSACSPSEKDRAEHVMLVDLGRNDLSRVCLPGTVRVGRYLEPERYSHVTHLVSEIAGELAPGRSGLDLLRACFPAGTVSGAPKVRAMQIIFELEGRRRGPYAGVRAVERRRRASAAARATQLAESTSRRTSSPRPACAYSRRPSTRRRARSTLISM